MSRSLLAGEGSRLEVASSSSLAWLVGVNLTQARGVWEEALQVREGLQQVGLRSSLYGICSVMGSSRPGLVVLG